MNMCSNLEVKIVFMFLQNVADLQFTGDDYTEVNYQASFPIEIQAGFEFQRIFSCCCVNSDLLSNSFCFSNGILVKEGPRQKGPFEFTFTV